MITSLGPQAATGSAAPWELQEVYNCWGGGAPLPEPRVDQEAQPSWRLGSLSVPELVSKGIWAELLFWVPRSQCTQLGDVSSFLLRGPSHWEWP